jgi:phosphoribosylglycinamide formyltransferase-1
VLASGAGSNLRAIAAAIDRGDLSASIVLVISNNSGSGALAFARARGVTARHLSGRTDADPDAALTAVISEAGCDGVILAGYAKRIPASLVKAYPERILNVHPAPLPRFGGHGMWGLHVHQAVLDAGISESGPTIHLVDEEYDTGPTLAHRPVPVLVDDTPESLRTRVQAAEHDLYWRVIADHFPTDESPSVGGAPS